MSENIRSTNLRFNLEKDTQKQAWQYLQTMDKQHFKSYSNVIAVALVEYFERYYRSQDDPYFETREREDRFVNQIISSVESAMEKHFRYFWQVVWRDCRKYLLQQLRLHSRNRMQNWIGISLENNFSPS